MVQGVDAATAASMPLQRKHFSISCIEAKAAVVFMSPTVVPPPAAAAATSPPAPSSPAHEQWYMACVRRFLMPQQQQQQPTVEEAQKEEYCNSSTAPKPARRLVISLAPHTSARRVRRGLAHPALPMSRYNSNHKATVLADAVLWVLPMLEKASVRSCLQVCKEWNQSIRLLALGLAVPAPLTTTASPRKRKSKLKPHSPPPPLSPPSPVANVPATRKRSRQRFPFGTYEFDRGHLKPPTSLPSVASIPS